MNLAAGYVDKKEEVLTLLQIRDGAPSNQVLLRVRFAEVSRSAMTELGVNLLHRRRTASRTRRPDDDGAVRAADLLGSAVSKASNSWGSDVTAASASSRSATSSTCSCSTTSTTSAR